MKNKPDHLCAFRGCSTERVWNPQRGCYNSRYCAKHARVANREQGDPVTHLRHPTSGRVLAINAKETAFIAMLEYCGYERAASVRRPTGEAGTP